MYVRVKHLKVSAVKNKYYIKNTAAAGVGFTIIRLNCSATTTRYTTVPRPHWRSRSDATRTTKYCQEVLEITNGVRDLRFLQRCFYRIKSCWVLYHVNWHVVPAWYWLWRHNVPPERQWTVHQSTRSNTPEDFNLQIMSSHFCYCFTHVSGDSGHHCGTW